MMEPLIEFTENVSVEDQRKILLDKIAQLEAELPGLEETAEKKNAAYKRARTALSNAQDRVGSNKSRQDRAAAQLRSLLPKPSGWELMEMTGLIDKERSQRESDSIRTQTSD